MANTTTIQTPQPATTERKINTTLNWAVLIGALIVAAIAFVALKKSAETQNTFAPTSSSVPNAAAGEAESR